MKTGSTTQLIEIYDTKHREKIDLEKELNEMQIEIFFRQVTKYDSKESLEPSDFSYFINSRCINNNTYSLYNQGIEWLVESNKDDKKCSKCMEDMIILKKVLNTKTGSKYQITPEKAKKLKEIFDKYSIKSEIHDDSLELYTSFRVIKKDKIVVVKRKVIKIIQEPF